jgi:hypothetical protein
LHLCYSVGFFFASWAFLLSWNIAVGTGPFLVREAPAITPKGKTLFAAISADTTLYLDVDDSGDISL